MQINNTRMNQGIIAMVSCVDWPAWYRVDTDDNDTSIFNRYQQHFHVIYHPHSAQSETFQNLSFTLLGFPLK